MNISVELVKVDQSVQGAVPMHGGYRIKDSKVLELYSQARNNGTSSWQS